MGKKDLILLLCAAGKLRPHGGAPPHMRGYAHLYVRTAPKGQTSPQAEKVLHAQLNDPGPPRL